MSMLPDEAAACMAVQPSESLACQMVGYFFRSAYISVMSPRRAMSKRRSAAPSKAAFADIDGERVKELERLKELLEASDASAASRAASMGAVEGAIDGDSGMVDGRDAMPGK